MFTSTKRFGKNPNQFFYDKSLPMGSISERDVDPILNRFVNPKGSDAYKNVFQMTNENDFVMGEYVCLPVTSNMNLKQVSELLGLDDSKSISLHFKQNKVTASCSKYNHRFGARGTNLLETLNSLVSQVLYYDVNGCFKKDIN